MESMDRAVETTLVVIIGASQFPGHLGLTPSPAFLKSANGFRNYILSREGFGLPEHNLLDLFDTDEEQPALDRRIATFLRKRKGSTSDVIIYYVGHGYFAEGNDYFLAIKRTDEPQPSSGYPIKALARTLKEHARHCRKFLLLDCCFAASAVAEFQSSGPLQVAVQKTAQEFEGHDLPGKGTALLCASGHHDPAKMPAGEEYTMFSGALMGVLHDEASGPKPLNLKQVRDLVFDKIRSRFKDDAVRPELHSPHQSAGDIADLPLFPTVLRHRIDSVDIANKEIGYHDALDPATFDSAREAIHCVVVLAEERADEETIPLHQHVRRAFDYHGGDIENAVTKYRAAHSSGRLPGLQENAPAPKLEFVLSSLPITEAFQTENSLARAAEAMCKADIVVVDVTDFEQQPGVLLLLGVRSVARRGVTICSVGGDYVIGAELRVPFDLQMLNLAAHSATQEEQGIDPRDLIGQKIANGFRELLDLPHYLDLPAYDSIRHLGVNSTAYRPLQYDEQVLILCPFSPEYTRRNWKRFLSKELSGKLKEHFRRTRGKENVDPRLVRLMDLRTPRLVAQTLYESIRLTDMCVVDWTHLRANVMYEAGVRLATNSLGAVHIIEANHPNPTRVQTNELTHLSHMKKLFKPIEYWCRPDFTEPYLRVIEAFEASVEKAGSGFDGLVYRSVGNSFDHTAQPIAMPVVEELVRSANLLLSDDQESTGICPVIYYDVNKTILEQAQEAAAERRLAAWLYLERRYPDSMIRTNEQLYAQFRTLGAQARRWLKRTPDAALDDYIKQRMQQVKETDQNK